MTRALLQWSDVRPTLLRAVGRSGVTYRIYNIHAGPPVRWDLYRFTAEVNGEFVSTGTLADMKALAEEHERDALGPAPEPQRIVWEKTRFGYWGVAPVGRSYRIRKITSDQWSLDLFTNIMGKVAEPGTPLDMGSLAAMKAAAQRDATEAARERANAEATPA